MFVAVELTKLTVPADRLLDDTAVTRPACALDKVTEQKRPKTAQINNADFFMEPPKILLAVNTPKEQQPA